MLWDFPSTMGGHDQVTQERVAPARSQDMEVIGLKCWPGAGTGLGIAWPGGALLAGVKGIPTREETLHCREGCRAGALSWSPQVSALCWLQVLWAESKRCVWGYSRQITHMAVFALRDWPL